MGLLDRLEQNEPQETCQQLRDAVKERYWDGLALATGHEGRRTGAIYLLGYVAELVVKVAFYRVTLNLTADSPLDCEVHTRYIKADPAWSRRRTKNFHDLEALGDVLIDLRVRKGMAFGTVFAGQLRQQISTVSLHWNETLRYRHSMASEEELQEVHHAVEWLLANQNNLWS